jgi:DNA-binding response OmpR family regulator
VVLGGKHSLDSILCVLSNSLGERGMPLTLNGVRIGLTESGVLVGGEPIELSPREYSLFCELARQRRRVVSKGELRLAAWGSAGDDHVVEVTIGRLRKRLGEAGLGIVSVPRRGYVMRP